ncbi:MAG TPA: hypothetical protein VHQ21_18935 [Rhodanobacteraceae bacterium]|nr:hypothetical protein [Rhodanobacteraceae bacterium]
MRRQTAFANKLFTAIALCLAVAPSAYATDGAAQARATSTALTDLAVSTSLIDAWRDYALASLKPEFSWASDGDAPIRAPSLFDRGRGRVSAPPSHFHGSAVDSSPFHVAMISSKLSDTPLYSPSNSASVLQSSAPGLQRYIIAPSLTQHLGNYGAVSVSAIFAYQHLADIGWTPANVTTDFPAGTPQALRSTDSSSGAGLRVDYSTALTDRVSWQAGAQSRVNMDSFATYRGIYAEPGTFDIPASANFGFGLAVSPEVQLTVGVERIMYSQVAPFTSSALPSRFLALLSSSASPVFAWQDLDVYSIGGLWHDPQLGDLSIRYSTREQPLPTSPLLQQALPEISPRNVEVGYAHGLGQNSTLRLMAAYVPNEYIPGIPQSYSLAKGGNQFEWGALWITSF